MLKHTITLLFTLIFLLPTNAQVDADISKMYENGKFQELIDKYGPITSQENPEILKALALSFYNLKSGLAYNAIDKAILLSENKIEFYYLKSQFHNSVKAYRKEIDVLKKILQIKNNAEILKKIAISYYILGDTLNSHKYIDKAIEFADNKISYYFFKSDI